MEGLQQHITEAEGALQQAEAVLKQEEEAREVRWKALVAEEDGKRAREIAASREKNFEFFYDLFERASIALGDLQLTIWNWRAWAARTCPSFFNFMLALPRRGSCKEAASRIEARFSSGIFWRDWNFSRNPFSWWTSSDFRGRSE